MRAILAFFYICTFLRLSYASESNDQVLNLKITPSCISIIGSETGIKTEKLKLGLNRLIKDSFKILNTCKNNYPELSRYINEAMFAAINSTYTCTKDKALDRKIDWGARAYLLEDKIEFPYDRFAYFTQEENVYWANNEYNWGRLKSTMIHELLHHTSANNRYDHDEIERIPPKKNGKCADDVRFDRVSVIQSLCSGEKLISSDRPAVFVIDDFIKSCPNKCEQVFESYSKRLVKSVGEKYSKGLSAKDSNNLCRKIQDDAHCHEELKKNRKEYDKKNSHLKFFEKPLKERLESILPKRAGEIPIELIKSFPNLYKGYKAISSDRCFQKHFGIIKNKDGNNALISYDLKSSLPKNFVNYERNLDFYKGSISTFEYRKISDLVQKSKGCKAVKSWIDAFATTIEMVDKDIIDCGFDYALSRAQSKGEMSSPYALNKFFITLECPKGVKLESKYAQSFFGKDLFQSYFTALKKHHSLSGVGKTCEELGLSPFRTLQKNINSKKKLTIPNDNPREASNEKIFENTKKDTGIKGIQK